ncbi:hypothetical protein [Fluviispira multicolorata]|uniref:Lipoprotein n=1 Tax=Fluviispira multicolorata TaxID=2654512 RepID=A0A833JDS2_9BACT|nr:hypothetical protein [Fluviispira multicolorata]KAB8029070.1 hypothetical protein GCL57_11055 [Fluviispira multicolorata]
MLNNKFCKILLILISTNSLYSCGYKMDPAPLYPTYISKIEEETIKRKKEVQKNSSDSPTPSVKKESDK